MPRTTLLRTVAAVAMVVAVLLVGQSSFGGSSSRPASITVKWGDTLWALSRRYGVPMAQLAAANHMKVTDVLLAGRTLTIPGAPGTASSTPTTSPSDAARQLERTFCATYQPPTGPRRQLPSSLASNSAALALRPVFAKWAKVYGVPVDLIEAEAWQESGWNNKAVSPAGALGIGQLMPATVVFVNQSLGTHLNVAVPSDNIRMMAAFLGYLLRENNGQVCGAVASYYQGYPTLVQYGVLPVSQIYVRDVLSLRPRFR